MRSLKILHLSTVKTWGGGENHIENLCLELQKHHVESIVLLVKNPVFKEKLIRAGIEHHASSSTKGLNLELIYQLIRMCRKRNIDLIHIHDPNALTLAIIGSHFYKLPDFIFSRKTSFPIKQRFQSLYKFNYKKLKKILCVSGKTREVLAKSLQELDKLSIVYHGCNIDRLKENRSVNLRTQYNLDEGTMIVGCIANHTRPKDLLTFVRTAHNVRQSAGKKKFHFILIGSFTEETPKIKKEITRLGLEEDISLTGFIPNASGLIPQFDISLITSKSEGVPQFIYESFYYGVPVVSTNVGGIPEVIEDGKNGFLSEPGKPELLARNLIALCQDKVLKEQFTEASYQKLMENFTTKIMAERTLAEYKEVVYGKNGTRNQELS